jgi:putative protein kinase ArgK-like GTPase of G3E family
MSANYVERKVPMEFIEKALFEGNGRIKSGSKRIVVTGIGGCGKTQLIRKFIEKYRDLCVQYGQAAVFLTNGFQISIYAVYRWK